MRTPAKNMENRERWLTECTRGQLATRRQKLGKYGNCEHPHIPLPPGKENTPILFLLPPDPLHVVLLGPVMDVFSSLKKGLPGVMTEFYGRCGIGRRRRMIAGNFTGVELKMLIKDRSLADLSEIIPNGLVISQYLESLRDLHRMCVKKTYSPDHQTYIDNFEERFKVVKDLGLVNFTTKVHIILHHIPTYMRETGQSLYSADTSCTESTHSGLKTCQTVHNLLSTHNLGTPGQQYRLKRSIMRYNWKNIPFDLREPSPGTTGQVPGGVEDRDEQEDLSNYVQDEVEVKDKCEECETVKQENRDLKDKVAELEEKNTNLNNKVAELEERMKILALSQGQSESAIML